MGQQFIYCLLLISSTNVDKKDEPAQKRVRQLELAQANLVIAQAKIHIAEAEIKLNEFREKAARPELDLAKTKEEQTKKNLIRVRDLFKMGLVTMELFNEADQHFLNAQNERRATEARLESYHGEVDLAKARLELAKAECALVELTIKHLREDGDAIK